MKERTVQHDKRITPRTAKRLFAPLICALATVNPLAGFLPLIDPGARFGGQGRGALQDAEVCRVLTSGQTPPVVHVGHG